MASSFPTSLDSFTDPSASDKLNSPSHALQHSNKNDAVEKLEAKVGIDSSAVTTSHDYKLSGVTGSEKATTKDYVDTPTKTVTLSATAWNPTTTAGCGSLEITEAGTNDVDYATLGFATGSDEHAFVLFVMPDGWDAGTITARFVWTAASGSGNVLWSLKGRAYANSDAIDQAYGTPQTADDTLLTAADVHISPATSAITLAGSPAGGQVVQFKLTRDVSGDNLGVDADLLAVKIEYGLSAHSD